MAPIFRALADPARRELLDRLEERDGQTLGELCAYLPQMTRFGVMKHLGVLEEAGLVRTVRVGREKRHFLDPVPIRLVHDRWIGKFAAPIVGAIASIKQTLEAEMATIDHVYSTYIKATPERVWQRRHRRRRHGRLLLRDARRVVLGGRRSHRVHLSRRLRGGRCRSVVSIEPGRSVTMLFHPRWDPDIEAEGPVRMTWAVEPADGGLTRLTVTSALIPGSRTESEFSGGVVFIVSGLKTFLEAGVALAAR